MPDDQEDITTHASFLTDLPEAKEDRDKLVDELKIKINLEYGAYKRMLAKTIGRKFSLENGSI